MQVNGDRSIWIKQQRLAAISIGWRTMLMSSQPRIRQIDRLVFWLERAAPRASRDTPPTATCGHWLVYIVTASQAPIPGDRQSWLAAVNLAGP